MRGNRITHLVVGSHDPVGPLPDASPVAGRVTAWTLGPTEASAPTSRILVGAGPVPARGSRHATSGAHRVLPYQRCVPGEGLPGGTR
jgi:hypothetical protein